MMKLQNSVCIFDVETIELPEPESKKEAREKQIEEWYNGSILSIQSKYKKIETQEKHIDALDAERAKRLSATDESWKFSPAGASPVAIAYRFGRRTSKGFDWYRINGNQGSEEEIVTEFVGHLNQYQESYSLCGYNILNFDLPILARVMKQYNIKLRNRPADYDIVDLTQFPLFRRARKSQDYWVEQFGGEVDGIDGSMVADMYASDVENNTQKVLEYCISDVEKATMLVDVNTSVVGL